MPAATAAKSRQSCTTLCDPIDGSLNRLLCPWEPTGKNTGVGCHFLLQCMKAKSESEVAQSCPTQQPHGLQPTRLLHPLDSPGKSTGVGCHCLLHCGCLPYEKNKLAGSSKSSLTWSFEHCSLEKFAFNGLFLEIIHGYLTFLDSSFGLILKLILEAMSKYVRTTRKTNMNTKQGSLNLLWLRFKVCKF